MYDSDGDLDRTIIFITDRKNSNNHIRYIYIYTYL